MIYRFSGSQVLIRYWYFVYLRLVYSTLTIIPQSLSSDLSPQSSSPLHRPATPTHRSVVAQLKVPVKKYKQKTLILLNNTIILFTYDSKTLNNYLCFSLFLCKKVIFLFMKYMNMSLCWYLSDRPGVHTKMAEGHHMNQFSTSPLGPHTHSFLPASLAGSLPTPPPPMMPRAHRSKIPQSL